MLTCLRKNIGIPLVLMLFVSPTLAQVGWFPDPEPVKRELTVYWTNTPPEMDGHLDEAVWSRLPRITGLVDLSFRHAYLSDQTLFSVAYDGENMYIAIDCRDRQPEKIKATVTERDGNFWKVQDETIELFFDADRTGEKLLQLAFNPLGTKFDRLEGKTTGWNGQWAVATKRTETGWTAEVAIPFADFPMKTPEPGFRLKANLGRSQLTKPTDPRSSWSVLSNGFRDTRTYGEWVFAKPDAKISRPEELAVNAEFIRSEHLQMKSLLEKAEQEIEQVRLWKDRVPREVAAHVHSAQTMAAELRGQLDLAGGSQLESLLTARVLRDQLSESLEAVALHLGLFGLTGPVDGLKVAEHGIQRHGNYWILSGDRGVYAVTADNGALAGIWDRQIGRRVLAASYDLYSTETMEEEKHVTERSDVVEEVTMTDDTLVFTCRNRHLPRLKITKRYRLIDAQAQSLAKHISVSASVKKQTLLGVSSNTLFDPEFRRDSFYNRMMSAGVRGGSDQRATIPATEITQDIIQRGGNDEACGWGQFVLANPKTGTGLAQYLYKMNGHYVWVPYAMTSSYWNRHGWEMGVMGTFLKEKPFTVEMRYHLFDGDPVDFYQEYLELPEVRSARAELPVNPSIAGLKGFGQGSMVHQSLGKNPPGSIHPRIRVPHRRLRSNEINVGWGIPRHSFFSDWPASDTDRLRWIDFRTQRETSNVLAGVVRQAVQRMKQYSPRHIVSLYWTHTDWHPETEAYREHPEFTIQPKTGDLISASMPYGAYEADMSKSYTDYVVPRYAKMVDYLDLGFIYFDFYGGSSRPDWKQAQISQTSDFMYFDKSIRKMLEDRNKFMVFNANPGQLYTDIGLAESVSSHAYMVKRWGDDYWRWLHERVMYWKLMERENGATVLLNWSNYVRTDPKKFENNRQYTNLLLALGLRPNSCMYDYGPELTQDDGTIDYSRMYNYEEPYCQAALEMHNTRIANVDFKPRHWTDPNSVIEGYVLRKGPAYFFTANNHDEKPRDLVVSADTAKLGFISGKRLFRWNYTRRDDTKVPRLIGPETPGWDRLFTKISCSSSILEDTSRTSVTFSDAEIDYTYLATLTQVPGVFVSNEGREMQFRLPQTLRCSLDGSLDEQKRTVSLQVKAVTPTVVAAWWPQTWGRPQAQVNGKPLASPEFVTYGLEQFVLIPIEAGTRNIEVTTVK